MYSAKYTTLVLSHQKFTTDKPLSDFGFRLNIYGIHLIAVVYILHAYEYFKLSPTITINNLLLGGPRCFHVHSLLFSSLHTALYSSSCRQHEE